MRNLNELSEDEILKIMNLVARFEPFWKNNNEPMEEEKSAVQSLGNDLSAHYGLIRIGATRKVFRAADNQGTIIHKYQNKYESIPFYPARYWVVADLACEYPTVRGVKMGIEEWIEKYLIPMGSDDLFVEILPHKENKALLVTPDKVHYLLKGIIGE